MGKNLRNIFIIVFIIAFVCCQKNVIESSISIEDAEDIVITENNDKPLSSTLELKFSQDLSLFEEEWWPLSLLIDEPGNIYVRTGPEIVLRKISPKGNEIDRKEFPKGQAPGEFSGFDPCLSKNGNIYIADWSQRRLTILDASFEILVLSKMKLYGFIFRLDSRNNMYFLAVELLPDTSDRNKLVFTKCSPSGEPVLRIHEYEWGLHRDNNGIYHSDAFRTQLRYKIDSKDNVYYAATNKYEINVISPDGQVIRRISKKGKSRKLTQIEINSFEPEKPNSRSITDIPENMPYIADLFILENDFLLAVTFESGEDDNFLLGDVFDDKGIYKAQVQVPKYYRWNYLIAPSKRGAVLKNNCFYTIESDENEEHFWVKRYKITLNDLIT
jgi:hypothetical protein